MLSILRPHFNSNICRRSIVAFHTNHNNVITTIDYTYNNTTTNRQLLYTSTYKLGGGHAQHRDGSFMYRDDVEQKVLKILHNVDKVDSNKLNINSSFSDLGLDDFDQMELLDIVENEFVVELEDNEAANIYTVKQLVDILHNHPFAQ